MRRYITLALLLLALHVSAQQKDEQNAAAFRFTTLKANPITSVKNQYKSGTCWCYATLGYFESEILRATGKTYDLSEMFVANKNYLDEAIFHTRMHGESRFSEGGSCDDALEMIKAHGVCPESVMAKPGSMVGDTLANFTEFFPLLEKYVSMIADGDHTELSPAWTNGVQGVIDTYMGKCPETFVYEGKKYTPQSFAATLGLNWDDYVSVTSFTHHPFYKPFAIEAPYKWRWSLSYNVPMDEMMQVIDKALDAGYTVAWGGDVSEDGFTRNGLALNIDNQMMQNLGGTDAARWLKLSKNQRAERIETLGVNTPEVKATQERRQKRFDNWRMTYDHVMLIYGKAKDQTGREFYLVKNSWGTNNQYKGTWYMSKDYIAENTIYVFLNKNAIAKDIAKKIKLQ